MKARLRLTYRPPYDWRRLLAFLQRRAIASTEHVEAGVYTRLVQARGGHAVLQVRQVAAADALELCLSGGEPADLLPLCAVARRMFDLAADPLRIAIALRRDPQLFSLVKRCPGLRIAGAWSAFESGVRAILGR